MERHCLSIPRTARYFTEGEPGPRVSELWFCFHGYAQLADVFLEGFAGIASPGRMFVAPEGLSRFYRSGGGGEIAASWMTSLERTDEIDDYVRYIDAVRREVEPGLDPRVRVTAFGFSQGAATAARWATLGDSTVDRLILWAGDLPPDLNLLAHRSRFQGIEIILVRGNQDSWISEERWAAEREKLRASGIVGRFVDFDGGHVMDAGVLAKLVS